jgi:hypothetical protein
MRTAWPKPLVGTWVPSVHGVCGHNDLRALMRRSLGAYPSPAAPRPGPFEDSFRRLRWLVKGYGGSRWSLRRTAESYEGSLRRRYLEAERSLMEDGPLGSSDTFLRAFLKAEKREVSGLAKPRLIFPRSPRYNLALASWLKPFEHWLWGNLKSVGSRGVKSTRVVGKGLGPISRAGLVSRKMAGLPDCVVFEVDGKAFEAHVDRRSLELEHNVYRTAYPGDTELSRLLGHQCRNRGVTTGGVRFTREAGRASGDFNTGMGNSLIMLCAVDATLRTLGQRRFDTLVDGDNALLFLPGADAERVRLAFKDMCHAVTGQEMVVERPVSVLEEVRFGQAAPVCVDGTYRMVRDWRKVLSGGTTSHRHLREPRFAPLWLSGVARCEYHLARGLPIVGHWAHKLLAKYPNTEPRLAEHLREYEYLGVPLNKVLADTPVFVEPSMSTRLSFWRAFGLPPDDQVALEASLTEPPDLATFGRVESEDFRLLAEG